MRLSWWGSRRIWSILCFSVGKKVHRVEGRDLAYSPPPGGLGAVQRLGGLCSEAWGKRDWAVAAGVREVRLQEEECCCVAAPPSAWPCWTRQGKEPRPWTRPRVAWTKNKFRSATKIVKVSAYQIFLSSDTGKRDFSKNSLAVCPGKRPEVSGCNARNWFV